MKRSLEIINKYPFPICVAQAQEESGLSKWKIFLEKKGVKVQITNNNGKYLLWREVTNEEKEEIIRGVWVIRGGSFMKVELARKRTKGYEKKHKTPLQIRECFEQKN